ncbi:MAG TPA: type I glyceraldehyde-3-phosphate dehydrogenase [Euryarchaeota archaeon]|nr:type I glyceraldehyde-3-phosphate dehydrogenase [Euryarchaeota archaeon]
MRRIAINGFGRIGRGCLRASLQRDDFGKNFQIVSINDLADIQTLAYLLRYDSVQGRLGRKVVVDGNVMKIDGHEIEFLSVPKPSDLPWKKQEIDFVLESTGLFRERSKAQMHIDAGAKRVVISAPAPDSDVTIVLGVNEHMYDPDKHFVISNASCTTNSLAPPVKVLHDNFGIKSGLMTTIHAYTGGQRIVDFPHMKDVRRGRAGAVSIIPTSSGAAKAINQVIPDLAGKLTGMALRVPTPDGSVTDLTALLDKEVTVDDVNGALEQAANSTLKGIMQYTMDPIVSVDVIGNPHSAVIDALSTMVVPEPGNLVKILSWYDNELGYANRLVDLMSKVI